MNKAQATIEFIVLLTTMILILIVTTALFQAKLYRDQQTQRDIVISGLLVYIQNELRLAEQANPGYKRVIELPKTINGYIYNLSLNNTAREITLSIGDSDYVIYYDIDINGTIIPGRNTITKMNKLIQITPR